MLVSAPSKRGNARHQSDEHLAERARLADTAGAIVVGRLTQALDRPHPATYLGSGKVEELKLRITERGATLVHAYADPWVIEGQGSMGLELAAQLAERGHGAPTRVVCQARGLLSKGEVEGFNPGKLIEV